ncbi:MAG: T6SS effector amidase Tae4 family protein [Bacteroidota bacterium]
MPSKNTTEQNISITFANLWMNYPKDPPCVNPNGDPPPGWSNQCAIKVSVALELSGVSFQSFSGLRCPIDIKMKGMIGSAQQLANWLIKKPFKGCPEVTKINPTSWEIKVSGKTGIIFFKDYWRRKGETRGQGSGDHIDLWKKDTLTPSLQSLLRFRLGIDRMPNFNPFSRGEDNLNWYSDLSKASEIWFWEIL